MVVFPFYLARTWYVILPLNIKLHKAHIVFGDMGKALLEALFRVPAANVEIVAGDVGVRDYIPDLFDDGVHAVRV